MFAQNLERKGTILDDLIVEPWISSISLSIPTEHASKAQKRKREVACLHAISPDVSIGKEGPCKLPVCNRPADRVHKSVHAAYYSHVRRIRSRAGKLAVSFASPFSLSSIRRDRSVFSPLSFSLPLSSSRRLWRSTDRESLLTFTGREEGRGGLEDRSADIFQRRNPLLLEDNFWEGGRDSYWVGFLSFLASR